MRHKRRGRALSNTGDRERDLSTIDLVNSILDETPVCYSFIRINGYNNTSYVVTVNTSCAGTDTTSDNRLTPAFALQVDINRLRKVCAVKGLVNNQVVLRVLRQQALVHHGSAVTISIHQCNAGQENRRLKCIRLMGLDDSMQLRARVWPVLLGVEGASVSHDAYMQWAHTKHTDSSVVDCDVQRSLWSYTQGKTERDAS